MARRAFYDAATRVLREHGYQEASGTPTDLVRDVPDDYSRWPGHWRLNAEGTDDEPYAAPDTRARGLAFARAIHLSLDGADAAAKFARGLALRRKAGGLVGAFVNNLASSDALSAGRLASAQADWAAIKAHPVIGLSGSDEGRLTEAEAAAVELAALDYRIDLAGD